MQLSSCNTKIHIGIPFFIFLRRTIFHLDQKRDWILHIRRQFAFVCLPPFWRNVGGLWNSRRSFVAALIPTFIKINVCPNDNCYWYFVLVYRIAQYQLSTYLIRNYLYFNVAKRNRQKTSVIHQLHCRWIQIWKRAFLVDSNMAPLSINLWLFLCYARGRFLCLRPRGTGNNTVQP